VFSTGFLGRTVGRSRACGVKFEPDFARRKRETDVSALFSKRRAFESRHNPTRDAQGHTHGRDG